MIGRALGALGGPGGALGGPGGPWGALGGPWGGPGEALGGPGGPWGALGGPGGHGGPWAPQGPWGPIPTGSISDIPDDHIRGQYEGGILCPMPKGKLLSDLSMLQPFCFSYGMLASDMVKCAD